MADINPPPVIEDLEPGDWIDLDKLGSNPLKTFIQYPDIAIDDALWPNWRGRGAQGEVADFSDSRVDVTVGGGYTPEKGMPVLVPNALLKQLDQGQAFYSYAVGERGNPNLKGPESLRVICYVGQQSQSSESLPVPQIKESHALCLDPGAVSSSGATAIVPPYQSMSVGDKVIFTWQGFDLGMPEQPHKETLVLKAEHIGQPLTFTVPYTQVIIIAGEYADISYRIEYADAAGLPSDSEKQRIDIVEPVADRLPPLTIIGHTGDPIDPGDYPQGLTLQVKPAYVGIEMGDWVVMYWVGTAKDKSTVKALRVDRSTLDSGLIEFKVEQKWLTANSNAQVKVDFQYARAGVAKSAETLPIDISKELYLPAPIVEKAIPDGGENRGRLAADIAIAGAYVVIPDSAEIGTGKVEMYWQGHPNGGQHVATTPESGRRFLIPKTAIAANMSALEAARFPVFYRVNGKDSVRFNLIITPLPATRYPSTQSPHVVGSNMSLFAVPPGGAQLVIESKLVDTWPFMAPGQRLTIEVSGVDKNGNATSTVVRSEVQVTEPEFNNKRITGQLAKAFLNTLKLNEIFTLKAKVSFDGGETYTPFRDTTPVLVA